MNLSYGVIKEAIDYISTKEMDEESKKKAIEILNNENIKERDELILLNITFFLRTPLLKELYNNKEIIINSFEKYNDEDYGFYPFFNYVSKIMPQLNFFNQEFIIEYLNKNIELIPVFVDYLSEPNKSILLKKYLLKNDKTDFNRIAKLSNEELDNFINDLDSDTLSKLYDKYFNGWSYISNSYFEGKMWKIFKDKIKKESLDKKLKYLERAKDSDLKKEIFNELNIIDNLESFIKYFEFSKNVNIFDYISEDIIFERCKKMILVDDYQKYLKLLSTKNQLLIVKELIEKKIPYYKYFFSLNLETLDNLYDSNKTIFTTNTIYELYKKIGDKKYLYDLKSKILAFDTIIFDPTYKNVLCDNDFVQTLSEEEKNIISNKMICDDCIAYSDTNNNYYFYNIYKEKFISSLLNEPKKQVSIYFKAFNFINGFDNEQRKIVLEHMSINRCIEYALDNEDNLNYLLGILKGNPKFLKNNSYNFDILGYVSEDKISTIEQLINYLDKEQYKLVYSSEILEKSETIRKYFNEDVINGNYFIEEYQQLKYIDSSLIDTVINNMDIKKIYFMFFHATFTKSKDTNINNLLLSNLIERIDELIDNYSTYDLNDIYKEMNDLEKKDLIDRIKDIEPLFKIVTISNNKDNYILNRILEICTIDFTQLKKININVLNEKQKKYLIDNMNIIQLFSTFKITKDNYIENKIFEKISKDINVLINDGVFDYIIYYINFISEERKEYIINNINDIISKNDLYSNKYKNVVKDFNILDKLNYLYLYREGYLNKCEDVIDELLKKDPFLFKTLSSSILNDKFLKMDMRFISKVSKYKELQARIKVLNEEQMTFLVLASKILNNNHSEAVFDKQMSIIIEYLSSDKSKLKNFDFNNINDSNINDIISYIICDSKNTIYTLSFNERYKTIDEIYDIKIDNYIYERRKKCDEEFERTINIDEMKNIYFNKYFSMSLSDASEIYQKYVINYDKVIKYAKNDNPLLFVNLITKIININDPLTLKECYYSNEIFFDISDIYEMESVMSQAYFDSLSNDYHDKQNGTIITKKIKDKDGNEYNLEMTELLGNFGILVHSTCAYGEMPMINNDYFDSWNYNPNTENHGICTSYITNSSYGTADVTGNGVMFGFTSLKNNSIAEYSPYDLATHNCGFNIVCNYVPFYTTLDEIDDYTRHTHNEFDLERRIPDDEYFCVQPDCIVIFEDMDDSIKANSIKAYQDFKKHGIELKIIYIDRVKIATMEAEKIKNMINEYINNNDLNLLKEIINKYESNICGCDYLSTGNKKSKNLFDKDILFMTETIEKLLFDTLDSIISLNDKDRLLYFKSILDNEQFKFDLLDDKKSERKHTFKLYSDELKERIKNAIEQLNIEYEEVKQY